MNKTTLVALALCFLSTCLPGWAQYSISQLDLDGAVDLWYDSVFSRKNPELYQGSFYDIPTRTISGHPFLGNGQWDPGRVKYRGETYENISMIYDLINGVLVLRNANFPFADEREFLQVNPQHVSFFQIEGFTFESYYGSNPPPTGEGFYQILHRGKALDLIAHRSKISRVGIEDIEFRLTVSYFIEHGQGYEKINGKRDLLKRYPEHKKAIKRFVRTNRLRLKNGDDLNFARVISYCDDLVAAS